MQTKVLVVSGPPDCCYMGWTRLPEPGHEYTQRHFFEWVFNGLTCAIMGMFGLGCDDLIRKRERVRDVFPPKVGIGHCSILLPEGFSLAPDVRLYCDTRKNSPRMPTFQIGYRGGLVEYPDAQGIYFDPLGAPHRGAYVSHGIDLANNNWLYWPQQR